MSYSISFNADSSDHLESKMFLDDAGAPAIQRFEQVRYNPFENFTNKQLSFFWKPEEVDVSKDKRDFQNLTPEQEHIFTSNLKRQIVLDSINGRGPNLTLLPIASLPEVEAWIETWSQNETLHSRAYTHVIRNVYPNPSTVFDEIFDIPEILDCARDISGYYDNLAKWNTIWEAKKLDIPLDGVEYDAYQHKRALWLALNSINALEGLRFYVSFACSWAFAELKQMEGNAKIIRLICRDENLHLGSTQYMLRTLPKDDPIFEQIREDTREEVTQIFVDVVNQEVEWAQYLFQHGSMIGLNAEILSQYIRFIASKRMRTLNMDIPFEYPKADPLPWTKNWISGKSVQNAPQETEITSYLISDIDQDVDQVTLNNLSI